jgi:site-specific DNA recombinase
MATRAAIYARISSDRDELRMGVDRQVQDCRALCDRNGWVVVGPYVDNDISAADPKKKRPEYLRMLDDIRARRVDAVVVWDEDRLHRQPIELEEFVAVCESAEMSRLASVGGDTDLNDSGALMLLRIKGAVAAAEVAKMRKRQKRKKQELAAAGAYGGGVKPFGYDRDGVTVVETEAALIREAAARVMEGSSLYSIRKDWKERGIKTATGKNEWSVTALRAMLIAPRVAGLRQHEGVVVGDAVWPAILDRQTWETVREILTNPARRQAPPSRDYPLRGVAKCAECESWLTSMPRKGDRLYGCRKDTGGCGHVMVTASHLERHVFGIMLPLADAPDILAAVRDEESAEASQASKLLAENSEDEKMLNQWASDYSDRVVSRADYLKQRARLAKRIEERTEALVVLRGSSALDRLGGQVQESWSTMSAEDKRLITQSLISEVRVRTARRRGSNIFDTGRVDIRWRHEAVAGRSQFWIKPGMFGSNPATYRFGFNGPNVNKTPTDAPALPLTNDGTVPE